MCERMQVQYLLWLLTGGNDTVATEDSISSGVDHAPDDAFELDDVECDAWRRAAVRAPSW